MLGVHTFCSRRHRQFLHNVPDHAALRQAGKARLRFQHQPVRDDRHGELLNLLRRHEIRPVKQRLRLRRFWRSVGEVAALMADAGLIEASGNYHAGRPLLITRNDYNLRLFNGDIGVLLQDPKQGELRAYFSGPEESLRDFLPLRLPEHETAYAMTVHKSQGSEFERVLMILPGEDSAILTRELVYTGLTRASKHVELWIAEKPFRTMIQRKISRRSGLRDALWRTADL